MTEAPECRECFDYGCQIYDHERDAARYDRRARVAAIRRDAARWARRAERFDRRRRRFEAVAVMFVADAELARAAWAEHRRVAHPGLFAAQLLELVELSEAVWDPDSDGDTT